MHSLLSSLLLGALAFAAAPSALQSPDDKPAPVERVRVPSFPNATCPIMGKPASTRLFVDTDKGRIYVCCKTCNKDVLADVEHAYKTAYPNPKKVANKTCPWKGEPVDEKSPTVVLQGFELRVCCADCIPKVRADAQRVLALLDDPKLVDVGNSTCPVTGEKVTPSTVAIIDGQLVRFSSAKAIEEARKDPSKVLAKAKEIRAAELEAQKKPLPR